MIGSSLSASTKFGRAAPLPVRGGILGEHWTIVNAGVCRVSPFAQLQTLPSLASQSSFGSMRFLLMRSMRARAGLLQAILLTRELPLEENDLPDDFVEKIRGLGRLEEDLWSQIAPRMVSACSHQKRASPYLHSLQQAAIFD